MGIAIMAKALPCKVHRIGLLGRVHTGQGRYNRVWWEDKPYPCAHVLIPQGCAGRACGCTKEAANIAVSDAYSAIVRTDCGGCGI
jgi:hypothetical protein